MGPGEIIIYIVVALAVAAIIWFVAKPKQALPPAEEQDALGKGEDAAAGEARDAAIARPKPEPEAKQPEPKLEAKQPEPEPEPEQAEQADDAPAEPAAEVEPQAPDAEPAAADAKPKAADADADAKPEAADAASEASDDPFAETSKPAAKPAVPRFAPPPTFAPPPSLKKPTTVPPLAAPVSATKPEPKPEPELPAKPAEPAKPAPEPEAGKPEPAEPESEPAKSEPAQSEPAKSEPAEPEPAQSEPAKPEPEPERAPVAMPVDKPKVATREEREQAELETKKSERDRYRKGLKKTKRGFVARLARLFKGRPKVSDDLKDDIEEVLFTADIGAKTAATLLESVTAELDKKEVADADAVWSVIRQKALDVLEIEAKPLDYTPSVGPYTLLMIGVNGVGKTTTIGKLAARHVEAGRKTLMVAGDTFRAAAGEQLEVWAQRVGCDIHLGKDGADPSSVLFDGISKGREQGYDVILCDTAGRLHTRKELMDELGKMGRAASKALSKGRDELEPHDTFLVLDATIGQNALAQAQLFKETMNFTGLVLTKLDGTAKGGVVLGVVDELQVPIRYIGIGEAVDDLRRFDPEAFCEVLFKPDAEDAENGDDD
ncbi:Signal recognition particle receptor protein FtsY [Enhygromyxa salina]|uniref:Signal recognition particle receptor FtsY n=1 Tax=Enhygromyxa salina TaxID=215803 RepID=A0A0C2CPS0_9BACT|nr:signal recognition particle-docking protein FtsY [Enhygromyxa salina]KIG13186.1 Signal recognition particle receptor protein FtsY [Enhygromyxa salina]